MDPCPTVTQRGGKHRSGWSIVKPWHDVDHDTVAGDAQREDDSVQRDKHDA